MISYGAVFVTDRSRGDHHFLERATTVGPRRVTVEITLDRSTHVEPTLDKWLLFLAQLLQVFGHLAVHSLRDHCCRLGTNT